jgi:molybdopterin biosynthesis enzyme MoaB
MKDDPGRSLTVGILALGSDGERCLSGLERALRKAWAAVGSIEVLREDAGDDPGRARATLMRWSGRERADVVLTIGRAGHRAEDFAPVVTGALLERTLPGIEERMCLAPPTRPEDLLFRGRAGFRGATLLVNLPGRAARAAAIVRLLAPVVGHALGKARGDATECARPGSGR